MGDCAIENGNKKRVRDSPGELESDSPELKRVNINTCSDPTPSESQRVARVSNSDERPEQTGAKPEGELDSPEASMIGEDILDIFDDTETVPATQDLDSVIRSFEEEILQASPSAGQPAVVELTSDSGESQPDLGYLLEASDDELGLPPTATSSEVPPQEPIDASLGNAEVVGLGNMAGFEDDLQGYDTFGLGLVEKPVGGGNYGGGGDFVTVDGLFDYADPSDFSDLAWRPESLSAL